MMSCNDMTMTMTAGPSTLSLYLRILLEMTRPKVIYIILESCRLCFGGRPQPGLPGASSPEQ